MRKRLEQTPRTGPRWRRRADARPEELLDAALATFAEQGFARSRLEDVARRAGVTKGTVYLYFDSKEALFRAVVKARVGNAVTMGEHFAHEFEGTTPELLAEFVRRYWSSLRQPANARLIRLAFTELGNFPDLLRFYMDEVVHRAHRLIMWIIERGIERGEFRPIAPAFAARALQAMCVHLAHAQRFPTANARAQLDNEEVVSGIVDLCLNGLLKDRRQARK